jgi:AT-rich DNA-binding protein
MNTQTQNALVIMKSTLSRLPLYYCYLKDRVKEGNLYISSAIIAESLKLNPVLVRKDLASVSTCAGKPRMGFEITALIHDLEVFLGYNNVDEAVLVGVGGLGRTLLSYEGFQNYGLNIVAGFDINEDLIGIKINGKPVLPMDKLPEMIRRMKINIGIITVPKALAQEVCDELLSCGIKAIWNFAPAHIDVPEGVLIKNENLAASLAVLSKELFKKLN